MALMPATPTSKATTTAAAAAKQSRVSLRRSTHDDAQRREPKC
jgi:hypothetical protein